MKTFFSNIDFIMGEFTGNSMLLICQEYHVKYLIFDFMKTFSGTKFARPGIICHKIINSIFILTKDNI